MQTRVFDEFRSGEAGLRGLFGTGKLWHGENVQLYANGSVGQRPGWRELTVGGTQLAAGTDIPRGILWRTDPTDTVDSNSRLHGSLVLIYTDASNTNVYFEPGALSDGAITFPNNRIASTTATHPVHNNSFPNGYSATNRHFSWHDGQELTIIGGTVYEDFDLTTPVFSNPNTSDGYASGAWVHRDRAYYYGFAAAPGRIYYSDPAAYATVPATSYFDVSYDPTLSTSAVVGMWTVSNALIIARRDGRWFVLSGVSPATGSLRDLVDTKVPGPGMDALLWNDEVWFLSSNTWGLNTADGSGVDITSAHYLSPTQTTPEGADWTTPGLVLSPVLDKERNLAFFPAFAERTMANNSAVAAIVYSNGVFSYDSFSPDLTAPVPTGFSFAGGNEGRLYAMLKEGSTWRFFVRDTTLDRPAKSTDSNSTSMSVELGADTSYIDLNEIAATPGSEIRLERIIIDYDYWQETGYDTASIGLDYWLNGIAGQAASELSTVASGTQLIASGVGGEPVWAATSADTGARRTSIMPFADTAYGATIGLRVNLTSAAIRRVIVEYDERKINRGR